MKRERKPDILGVLGMFIVLIPFIVSDSVYGSIGESDIDITIVDPPSPSDA